MWWIVGIVVVLAALALLLVRYAADLIYPYRDFVSRFVKNPPFVDRAVYFPSSHAFEDNWQAIRDEIAAVMEADGEALPQFHDLDPTQAPLSNHGGVPWFTFMLLAYGNWVSSNAVRCPRTCALIRQDPRITTAMFSILPPHKEIPPHRGLFKGVLRYHLGLRTPRAAGCRIIVGGQEYSWAEGEGVVFDDTYLHEVKNATDELRIVLFLDVMRVDGPVVVRVLDRAMYWLAKHSRRAQAAAKRAETFKPAAPAEA